MKIVLKTQIITLFFSILELIRLKYINVYQGEGFFWFSY